MDITEKDIFNFVFNSSLLPEEKMQYIKNNIESYPQIEIFRDIKISFGEEFPQNLKEKLAQNIPVYKSPVVYELYPRTIEAKDFNEATPLLAAASGEVSPSGLSKTFIDSEKNIMIRLVGTKKRSKLFVFPVSGNKIGEFSLTLNPGYQQYYFKDSFETKIIEDIQDIQSISIELYPQ